MTRLMRAMIAGGAIGCMALSANAAGLGRLNVLSSLGQPLRGEIELVGVQAGELDGLAARIAPLEAYQDAHIEYSRTLNGIGFSVATRANGQPYLKVSSPQPINDPFLDLLVELTSPSGRLLRQFPLLLDPPVIAPSAAVTAPVAQPASPAPAVATPIAGEPAPRTAVRPPPRRAVGVGGYVVQPGDTLYRVAAQVKPQGATVDQTLLALHRNNPGAFIGGNPNLLKAGEVLKVPSASDAGSVAPAQATSEFRSMSRDWANYRRQMSGDVAAAPASPAGKAASGKIGAATPVTPGQAGTGGAQEVLKLSGGGKGDAAKGGTGGATEKERLIALQEEISARENQIKEVQARIAELQKTITDMQQLRDLQSQAPAEAAKKAAEAAPPAGQAALPPAQPVAAPAPAEPKPAEAKAPEAKPAEATPAEAKPAPAKPAPPPKVAVHEPSFIESLMENPMYLAAGGAVVLLGGFLGFSAWRRRQETQTGFGASTGSVAHDLRSGIPAGKSGMVDTGNSSFLTDFEKTGPGMIDTEEVDPVAEAEVYIAYGREAQAEEILREAMAKDPKRTEIPLKMLEIYAQRKNVAAFETLARQLESTLGRNHLVWNRAVEMGRQIDPGNPLYDASAPAETRAPLPVAAATAAAASAVTAAAATPPPAMPSTVDLDVGAPATSPAEASQAPTAIDHEGANKPADNTLEFDVPGLDLPAAKPAEPPAAPAARAAFGGKFTDDALDLSDFSLDLPTRGPVVPEAPTATAPAEPPELDLSLDAPGGQGGGLDLDLEGKDAGDSVATKLELAKAYIEMGEKESAREILGEVMQEGSALQRQEARALSASLG